MLKAINCGFLTPKTPSLRVTHQISVRQCIGPTRCGVPTLSLKITPREGNFNLRDCFDLMSAFAVWILYQKDNACALSISGYKTFVNEFRSANRMQFE